MRIFTIFVSLLIAMVLAACGGGGGSAGVTSGSPIPTFVSSAPAAVTIGVGASADYNLAGGTRPYRVSNSNSQAVLATLRNETVLSIGGVNPGTSNVTLTDADNKTVSIAVTVANLLPLSTNAPTTGFSLSRNTQRTFTISGGVPGYTVVSSDPRFVTATLAGNTVTLNTLAIGASSIRVRDAAGVEVVVPVAVIPSGVPITTNAPAALPVAIGTQRTFTITGGAPGYTAESTDPRFVTASISGNTLIINAVAITTAGINVIVRDSENITSAPISVTVVSGSTLDLFTTAPAAVSLPPTSSTVFAIGGGVAPYSVVSSNPQFVTATINGSVFTIQTLVEGNATLTIRDASGKTTTTLVTVVAPSPFVTPNNSTGLTADTLFATITNGTPPYRTEVGNSLVATAKVTNQNRLEVILAQAGNTIVTVLDANNKSAAFTITVTTATPTFRLSPAPVTVSENDSAPIVFTVFGGAPGAVTAFSSDTNLLQVSTSADGRTVTAVTGTRGNRCVEANTNVTITAVDSVRAVGTSVVTIQNNLTGCNAGGATALNLSSTAVNMTTNSGDVNVIVAGGGGTYVVSSSNTAVATATVTDNVVIIKKVAVGNATITVRDSVNTQLSATIAVTVAAP